jgi:hypothetical protein
MRQVRRELGEDVDGIVDNAQVLTDWRYYVRTYPWICLGAAAAVGFLIVPSRPQVVQPDPKTLAELVKARKIVVTTPSEAPPRPSMAASVGSVLARALLQGGLALLKQQFAKGVEAHFQRSQHASNGSNGRGTHGEP